MQGSNRWLRACALVVLWIAVVSAAAQDATDIDWPCIQRKVPEITAGTIWAGPEIDAAQLSWRRIDGLADVVAELAARRLSLADAYIEIDKYAAAQSDDNRNARLAALFAGLLQTINRERNEIISGIERFDRRQKSLAERIKGATRRRVDETNRDELARLDEQILWDTRLYDERNQLLTYVCESPVLLEHRLFSLSRHIMSQLVE